MNEQIKAVWVKALRSGKYKQWIGGLRRKNAFCCLGVLCDLGSKKDWRKDTNFKDYTYGDEAYAFPPDNVLKATGLSKKEAWELARLNDQGFSFKVIADYIEEHL